MAILADPVPSRASRLAGNILYGTIALAVVNLSQFVAHWAVIRWYGKGFHGSLVWIASVVQLMMLASDLGLAGKAGMREIARDRAASTHRLTETISAVIAVPLLLAGLLGLAMILLAAPIGRLFEGEPLPPLLVAISGTWVVLQAAVRACRTIAVGFERFFDTLFMVPIAEAGKTIWVFVCVAAGLAPVWIFIGWSGAFALSLAVSLPLSYRLSRQEHFRLRLRFEPVGTSVRRVIRALPYYVPQLGILALPFLMPLLIGAWHSSGQVSTFRVCFLLAFASRFVSAPISAALLPHIAHDAASGATDHGGTVRILLQLTRFLGLVSTLLFALYWAWGGLLLTKLFGADYGRELPALLILAFAVGVENYSVQLDQVLMAMTAAGRAAVLELLKNVLLIAVGWFVIPRYGTLGAAALVAATTLGTTLGKLVVGRRQLPDVGARAFFATLAVFAVIAATGVWLPHGRWGVLPVWLLATVALGLLRPRQLRAWVRTVLQAVRPGAGP